MSFATEIRNVKDPWTDCALANDMATVPCLWGVRLEGWFSRCSRDEGAAALCIFWTVR
jgi:hypothetical protein